MAFLGIALDCAVQQRRTIEPHSHRQKLIMHSSPVPGLTAHLMYVAGSQVCWHSSMYSGTRSTAERYMSSHAAAQRDT